MAKVSVQQIREALEGSKTVGEAVKKLGIGRHVLTTRCQANFELAPIFEKFSKKNRSIGETKTTVPKSISPLDQARMRAPVEAPALPSDRPPFLEEWTQAIETMIRVLNRDSIRGSSVAHSSVAGGLRAALRVTKGAKTTAHAKRALEEAINESERSLKKSGLKLALSILSLPYAGQVERADEQARLAREAARELAKRVPSATKATALKDEHVE